MIARLLNRTQTRRELRSPAWFADYTLALTAVAIACLGIAMNYASTWRSLAFEGGDPWTVARRQAIFVGIGIVVMVVAAVVDYRALRFYATPAYLAILVALGALLRWGPQIRNARSWFELPVFGFQVQPSEFAKLIVIVSLAAFVASHEGYLRFDTLFNAGVAAGGADGPDLPAARPRTMLVFVAIAMGMLLVAGAQLRHIVVVSLAGVLALVLVFSIDALQGPRLLNETQRNRLTAFLDQDFEPLEPPTTCGRARSPSVRAVSGVRAGSRARRRTSPWYPSSTTTSSSRRWGRSSASSAARFCSRCMRTCRCASGR